jgi:RsiW-degrading membrane proteinase PrsW (M82 family)
MNDSFEKNRFLPSVALVFAAAVAVFIVVRVWRHEVAAPISFKPISGAAFAGLIVWLFAVAVFVERAIEVIVMVFRDRESDLLDEAEQSAQQAVASASDDAAKKTAQDNLASAHHAVVVYHATTKEFALRIGFLLGALVSLAGVRALHGLVPDTVTTGRWFALADIVVTSAMLAGGSEGIHRMANVVTSFADSLSTQLDQKNKK